MTDWVVRRWARYGHERLYAETPGGTALGYLDVKTGRLHSDDLTNLPLLERAIQDHLLSQNATHAGSTAELPAGGAPATPEPALPSAMEWADLSHTLAGTAARERALAERAAQGRARHFIARLTGAKTEERAWRVGAEGEQAVAEQLAKLGPDWRVLHAIRVGSHGADIDHLVIGPAGVFTVNAKHHPHKRIWVGGDTFLVNGHPVPYVRNSRYEASRAARLLSEHVGFPVQARGVVAVMGAHKGLRIKEQPADGAVLITQRRRIPQLLLRQPSQLTAREIAAIYEVARRSTTWRQGS